MSGQLHSPRTSQSQPSDLQRLAGMRLILIDDEPGVLRALSLVLQAYKCVVSPHNRPEDGVAKLVASLTDGTEWDLIVCDLRMPRMSGLNVLSSVRRAGSKIPFLLMSGHATCEDIDEAASLGAAGFLPKPFTPPQLAAEIARLRGRVAERK